MKNNPFKDFIYISDKTEVDNFMNFYKFWQIIEMSYAEGNHLG